MNQFPDPDPDQKLEMVGRAADQLAEHFDSVIILCTGPTSDGTGSTTMFKQQRGNVHAHEGAMREALRETEAYQNAYFGAKGERDGRKNL